MARKKRTNPNAPPAAVKVPYTNAIPYSEENLCSLVRRYEAIWKPTDPGYYSDKTALWAHIAKKFLEEHVTGFFCLENYERLRDNRAQKLRRLKEKQKSGSAGGQQLQAPKDLLSFLDSLKSDPSSRESSIVFQNAQGAPVIQDCSEAVHEANERREADAALRDPPPSTPQRRQGAAAGGGGSRISPRQLLLTPRGLQAQRARLEEERRQRDGRDEATSATTEAAVAPQKSPPPPPSSPSQPAERRTARGRLLKAPDRFSPPAGGSSSRSRAGSASPARSTGSSASGASATSRGGRKRRANGSPKSRKRLSVLPERDEVDEADEHEGSLHDYFFVGSIHDGSLQGSDHDENGFNHGSENGSDLRSHQDALSILDLTESERRRTVTDRRRGRHRDNDGDHQDQRPASPPAGGPEGPTPPIGVPPEPTPQLARRQRAQRRGARQREEPTLQDEEDIDDPGNSPRPAARGRAVARTHDHDHEERQEHVTGRQALAQAIEARRRADRLVARRRQVLDALQREERLNREARQRQLQVEEGPAGAAAGVDTAEVRLLQQLVNGKQMDGCDAFGCTVAEILRSFPLVRRTGVMTNVLNLLTDHLQDMEESNEEDNRTS